MSFNTGIVLFNRSAFGGAERRLTNLFKNLAKTNGNRFYYFVNHHLFSQLKLHFPELPYDNVITIDYKRERKLPEHSSEQRDPKQYYKYLEDPVELDLTTGLPRKVYWFYKNMLRQHMLFRQIDGYRKKLNIKVFLGVFSGVLPLVFYLKKQPRRAAVIFSDMDSWFLEVHEDMNRLWYRKYYSFNYALRNCDLIDFLSPFIYEGVRSRGVRIPQDRISIADSSFADYSMCRIGEKRHFEIAFCARMEPDKNPLLYVEAASEIVKKHPHVKFHLIGEGSLVDKISEFINSRELNNKVIFTYLKNPAVILANTSVFVSIQSTNNYPSQSVLEAMACGNAVVATDVGDTRMFINERNGILIPLELKSLTEAIQNLISNPEKTRQLGMNAREFVLKNHTIEKSLAYYRGLFKRAYGKIFAENE